MRIDKNIFEQHKDCEVYVDCAPRDKQGRAVTQHAGALCCKTHRRWLKWVGTAELQQLTGLVEFYNDWV